MGVRLLKILLSGVGFALMYIGVFGIVYTSDHSKAQKNTWMQSVFADLEFFYDEDASNVYNSSRKGQLYDGKWSGPKFPSQRYQKVTVWNKGTRAPAPVNITTVVTTITVESH